ncbi:MAG: hypothetical protein ACM3UY_08660 [Methanocella sp.]
MEQKKTLTPLKIGLIIVALAYFLFTLHATFVLSWVGEWEPLREPTRSWIFVTDVTAFVFLIFRFLAGILAATGAVLYFIKGLSQSTAYKILRAIIVLEGLYWVGLLPSGIWGLLPSRVGINWSLLISTGIPCIVASISIPICLFMLARKLNPDKAPQPAIKWATLAGFFYVVALWLNNSGMWIITGLDEGWNYIFNTPQYLLSVTVTLVGLLALAVYAGYFAKKSMHAISVEAVSLGGVGVILTALGTYFLWNYLTWIFFGGWNEWYAWILGHNLDLWMLALPLAGIPLLLYRRQFRAAKYLYALEAVGAVFVAIFLGAYLAGIPTTAVYHSEEIIRYSLYGLGIVFLVLILVGVILAKVIRR